MWPRYFRYQIFPHFRVEGRFTRGGPAEHQEGLADEAGTQQGSFPIGISSPRDSFQREKEDLCTHTDRFSFISFSAVRRITAQEWNKHWFVLRGCGLMYYRDPCAEDKGIMDGVIDLNTVTAVTPLQVARNYGFQTVVSVTGEFVRPVIYGN